MKAEYLLVVALLALSGMAEAEQGCASGFHLNPNSTPGGPMCIPIPGYGTTSNSSLPPTGPQWVTRWGAIAMDSNGSVGTATGMRSKRQAKKAATAECLAKGGGTECKKTLTYFNQCGVVVWGASYATTASAETIEQAAEIAKRSCSQHTTDCQIYYSDCSLPERIQ